MSLLWGAFGSYWELRDPVTFDGLNKLIIVNPSVTSIDIRADVYSSWIKWIANSIENKKWPFAMRYSGMDSIPGGESGGIFFLYNGWKLIIDFNFTTVTGVLYSDNYSTAYYSNTGKPLFPATVSALVNSVVVTQNIVTGVALTAEQTANAVWDSSISNRTSGSVGYYIYNKVLNVAKFLGLK